MSSADFELGRIASALGDSARVAEKALVLEAARQGTENAQLAESKRANDLMEADLHLRLALSPCAFPGEWEMHTGVDEEGELYEHADVKPFVRSERQQYHFNRIVELLGLPQPTEQEQ